MRCESWDAGTCWPLIAKGDTGEAEAFMQCEPNQILFPPTDNQVSAKHHQPLASITKHSPDVMKNFFPNVPQESSKARLARFGWQANRKLVPFYVTLPLSSVWLARERKSAVCFNALG